MTSANFEETPAPVSTTFRLPADYYSTPPAAVFPPWVPFGCGGLSLFALLIVFAGGAFLSTGGFALLLDLTLVQTTDEIEKHYTADVTADHRRAFEAEMKTLRTNLKNEKVTPAEIQPMLRTILAVGADEKATDEEIRRLTDLARNTNAAK